MNKSDKNLIGYIDQSIKIKKKIPSLYKEINKAASLIYKTLKLKKKVFICGNGGSAADAQHLAAEFMIRLRPNVNRAPYPVISLALDTSTITACSNDYSFNELYSRNLEGLAQKGDLLIVISTSGNSKNIVNVLKISKKIGVNSIALLGNKGGKSRKISNVDIIIPSKITSHIQESHITIGHYLALEVEEKLLKK